MIVPLPARVPPAAHSEVPGLEEEVGRSVRRLPGPITQHLPLAVLAAAAAAPEVVAEASAEGWVGGLGAIPATVLAWLAAPGWATLLLLAALCYGGVAMHVLLKSRERARAVADSYRAELAQTLAERARDTAIAPLRARLEEVEEAAGDLSAVLRDRPDDL